jgi:hypothetical protein
MATCPGLLSGFIVANFLERRGIRKIAVQSYRFLIILPLQGRFLCTSFFSECAVESYECPAASRPVNGFRRGEFGIFTIKVAEFHCDSLTQPSWRF